MKQLPLPPLIAAAAAVAAPPRFHLATVTESLLERAFDIESASYPLDEAATREKLQVRIREAPEFFYGAFEDNTDSRISPVLQGFICGTLTSSETLTDEAMSTHDPLGRTLCIHSVVVDAAHRRQGVATWMLKNYLARIAEHTSATNVLLICKDELVKFYESCGFASLGRSDIVHGQDSWIDMGLAIRRGA